MKFKKTLLAAVLIFMAGNIFAFTFDLELPLKIVLAKTENEFAYDYCASKFLDIPVPLVGPVRAQYVFNPGTTKGWTFSAGLSSYVFPFQTLALSASASYRLCTFKNGGTLELKNTLDAGLFCLVSSFYDVEKGMTVTKPWFSPGLEYSLTVEYMTHGKVPVYFAAGPGIALASAKGSFFLYYGVNVLVGFRIGE